MARESEGRKKVQAVKVTVSTAQGCRGEHCRCPGGRQRLATASEAAVEEQVEGHCASQGESGR